MNKRIFITNGMACSGKDTFANMLNDIVPTMKISSIDYIKQVARHCGWDGEKDEKSRKFLCDLKNLTTEYNDLAFRIITSRVLHFYEVDPRNEVLLIDIREPDEIRKFCKEFPETKTILITRKSVKNITSNVADAGVFDYDYNIVIRNDGDLDTFRETVVDFVNTYLREV